MTDATLTSNGLSEADQREAAWSNFCRETPVHLRCPWEAFVWAWEARKHSNETCEQSRGVIYMPCERHKQGTFTMSVGYVPIPKAVCPMCVTEQSTAQKASERQPCSHGNATGHCQHCLDAL